MNASETLWVIGGHSWAATIQNGPVSNADQFLAAFRAIEGELRRRAGVDRSELKFAELLRRDSSGVIEAYRVDLREFAQLRNAIIHASDESLLAEPTDAAVQRLERILALVKSPPELMEVIGSREVTVVAPTTRVRQAALLMQHNLYSQLPVYEGAAFHGLLTSSGVAYWLGRTLELSDGLLKDVAVEEVLTYEEDPETYEFLPTSATVFDALVSFERLAQQGRALNAILLTEGGLRDARPLNIVTAYDVPRMRQGAYAPHV